ncbi:MAG: Gfo/Idh/MocA family oxidoreductase [Pseudomonadota bacterium]
MSETPFRVAVLGAGYFARFHHEAWQRLPDADLVGVADRELARAAESGATAFDSLETMLEATRPEILDIATPPPTHLEAIEAGLAAGVRAIICQKPFCGELAVAERATALAEAAGVPLVVHENFRFQPWYRAIRAAIAERRIGAVHQVTFRLRTGDGQGPRAYLDRQPYFQTMPRLLVHETAVHWLDTFRYLLGPAESVYADLRRMNPVIAGEDAGHILLGFAGGVRALFDGNRLLDHVAENHRLTLGEALVEGTEGTLTLTGDGAVHLRGFGSLESTVLLAPRTWPGFAGDCVHALQAHVLAGLRGDAPFENEARDYLTVMRMEAAAYRSAETGTRQTL